MLNFNPPPTAVYRMTTGQTIPYWLYLRILHLAAISEFGTQRSLNITFVTSTIRAEGYDVSDPLISVLEKDSLQELDLKQLTDLKALDADQMKPKYDRIPRTNLRYNMEAITPRVTVSMSDVLLNSAPVSMRPPG